jgi:hypothetical protein
MSIGGRPHEANFAEQLHIDGERTTSCDRPQSARLTVRCGRCGASQRTLSTVRVALGSLRRAPTASRAHVLPSSQQSAKQALTSTGTSSW